MATIGHPLNREDHQVMQHETANSHILILSVLQDKLSGSFLVCLIISIAGWNLRQLSLVLRVVMAASGFLSRGLLIVLG